MWFPPVKPDYLDDVASAKWDELIDVIEATHDDAELLELYCVTYSQYRKALASVEQTGQVIVKRKDGEVEATRNPFSVELHKYADRLKALQGELGLTRKARGQEEEESGDRHRLLAIAQRLGVGRLSFQDAQATGSGSSRTTRSQRT